MSTDRTVTLTHSEVFALTMHISDDILQDGWYEMARDEFNGWLTLLRKLGEDTTHWERRYAKMEANLL